MKKTQTLLAEEFAEYASKDMTDKLQEYLDCGIDINYRQSWVLRYSVMKDALKSVVWLLERGCNPNAMNGYSVRLAISGGKKHILMCLLERGGRIDAIDAPHFKRVITNLYERDNINKNDYEEMIMLVDTFNQKYNN